jgi:uncharacterized Ntn-hydrolase superfamily protein
MTFSIAAYDAEADAFGIAVASKFLAVGAMVCWARGGVGVVATQALAKIGYGPDGLALLAEGKTARETLDSLLAADPMREQRQVGIVDRQGNAAAHTGSDCFDWAGHRTGAGFSCQGNILVSAATVDALADTFVSAKGELADRLMAALLAGEAAGGDKRGKQGAALVVVSPGGGYGGDTDRYIDLRVDDDVEPVAKLRGLLDMHHLFFGTSKPEDRLPIDEAIARELQAMLRAGGYVADEPTGVWDDASKRAFWAMVGNENLEERWQLDGDPDVIDRVALDYLRQRFAL